MPILLGDLDLLKNGSGIRITPNIQQTTSRSKIIRAETVISIFEPERSCLIEGVFRDDIDGIADYNTLQDMLSRGSLYLLTFSKEDESDPVHAFVRTIAVNPTFPPGRSLDYAIDCFEVPAWGRVSVVSGDTIYLLDQNYSKAYEEILSPLWIKTGWIIDRWTRYFEQNFYLRNDNAVAQDPVLEIQVPDNLSKVKLYYYKSVADGWTLIGDWGGADAWGATKNFTDAGSVSHDATLDKTNRNGTISGIGTASLRFGCWKRVLLEITNMSLNDAGGADSKTKYSKDQLLLRLKVYYTSDVTTWIDSST